MHEPFFLIIKICQKLKFRQIQLNFLDLNWSSQSAPSSEAEARLPTNVSILKTQKRKIKYELGSSQPNPAPDSEAELLFEKLGYGPLFQSKI
jgi:hypothetical protein